MNRIRAFVLAASLLFCAAPMLLTTASAAETDEELNGYVDDWTDSMNKLESSEGFLTEEQIEKVREFLTDFLNLDALSHASSAIRIFLENTYISKVFLTAFLMSLVTFIMRGN